MKKPVALTSFLAILLGTSVALAQPAPLSLLGAPAPGGQGTTEPRRDGPGQQPQARPGAQAAPGHARGAEPDRRDQPGRADQAGARATSTTTAQGLPRAGAPLTAGAPRSPAERAARRDAQQRALHAELGSRRIDEALGAELRRHAEVIARIDRVAALARAASDAEGQRRAEAIRQREDARHQAFLKGAR